MALRLRFCPFIVLVLVFSTSASAQIYSWRDASGTLVISDKPPSTEVSTYLVARSTSVRTTRPVPGGVPDEYDQLVGHYAKVHSIRPDLVHAVIQVESGYNPTAVSPKGALGLMQLMPSTARTLGVRNAFDPEQNIKGGTSYLRQLLDRFNQNEELALAAYNAGPETVDRYGQKIPPYRETRDYVRKVGGKTAVGKISSASRTIYKYYEVVDGRPVVRYSDRKPASGEYEVVSPRR